MNRRGWFKKAAVGVATVAVTGMTLGKQSKGGVNPLNTSDKRPPDPMGSGSSYAKYPLSDEISEQIVIDSKEKYEKLKAMQARAEKSPEIEVQFKGGVGGKIQDVVEKGLDRIISPQHFFPCPKGPGHPYSRSAISDQYSLEELEYWIGLGVDRNIIVFDGDKGTAFDITKRLIYLMKVVALNNYPYEQLHTVYLPLFSYPEFDPWKRQFNIDFVHVVALEKDERLYKYYFENQKATLPVGTDHFIVGVSKTSVLLGACT